jgi:hypothetical protein
MMLKIRKEQMEVFEQAAIRNFEDEMVQHLKKFSPRHCDVIGEDNVREVIRLGIERGKKYNLTNREIARNCGTLLTRLNKCDNGMSK